MGIALLRAVAHRWRPSTPGRTGFTGRSHHRPAAVCSRRLGFKGCDPMNYHALVQSITALHADSVGRAASAVNQALVLRNWAIGTYIVEFEQNGEDRAEYGEGLLRRLSSDLGACGIKGVSPDMLERMRLFSRHHPQLADSLSAPVVRISTKHAANPVRAISAPAVRKSEKATTRPSACCHAAARTQPKSSTRQRAWISNSSSSDIWSRCLPPNNCATLSRPIAPRLNRAVCPPLAHRRTIHMSERMTSTGA